MNDFSCFSLFMSALCALIFTFLRETETAKAYSIIFLLLSFIWIFICICISIITKPENEKQYIYHDIESGSLLFAK